LTIAGIIKQLHRKRWHESLFFFLACSAFLLVKTSRLPRIFRAEPGTQWYYHNAPYTLLEKVVPSQNMVVIRMGMAPDESLVPIQFHDEMWRLISGL
jgi:hypothetical protein